jgi:hypothetical protein
VVTLNEPDIPAAGADVPDDESAYVQATVTLALDVLPVPPSFEETVTLLFFTPMEVPVTVSETVHWLPAASVPAERLTESDPGTAVTVPPQLLLTFGEFATGKPAGRESVNASPVIARALFVLAIVNVSVVLFCSAIVGAPNALMMNGAFDTVRSAELVLPLPAAVELMVTLLLSMPSVLPVTFTPIVHGPTGSADVLKLMLVPDATAVTVPPHVFETLGLAATVSPVGRVSTKLVSIVVSFGFVIAKLTVLMPLGDTRVGLKLLEMDGLPNTSSVPDAVFPVPPLDELTVALLVFAPMVEPVTLRETVHVLLAPTCPPDRATELAVVDTVPPHVLLRFGVVATVSPAGRESLNARPDSVDNGFELPMT